MVENNCDECGVPIPKSETYCPPCGRRQALLFTPEEKEIMRRETEALAQKNREEMEKRNNDLIRNTIIISIPIWILWCIFMAATGQL